MIKQTYFQAEIKELDDLEIEISDIESKIQEAIESVEIEAETDDEGNESDLTVKYVIDALVASAHDLLGNYVDSPIKLKPSANGANKFPRDVPKGVKHEVLGYLAKAQQLSQLEAQLRATKKIRKEKELRLEDLVDAKKYGRGGYINHLNDIIVLREADLAAADKDAAKRKIQKEIDSLHEKKDHIEDLILAIGHPITDEEARDLIILKHHGLIQEQLERYLNYEKRKCQSAIEKLWDKYSVSRLQIETSRAMLLTELDTFLTNLKYI
jgi:type I restriction enzyme M protein